MEQNFILKEKKLKDIVEYILKLVSEYSATAKVLVFYKLSINLNIRHKKIDFIEFGNDNFITITVYKCRKKSTVSSNDFTIPAIHNMIKRAIDIINYISHDSCSGLPDRKLLAIRDLQDLDLYHYWKWDINYASELVLAAEEEAFKSDKRITNTEGSTFNSCINLQIFGNSHGMLESYKSTSYFMSSCMIAKDNNNMQRDAFYTVSRSIHDLISPKIVGITSANRAISRLNSRKLLSMDSPIIFSSELSSEFFSYLAKAIDGHNVYKKSTFLSNSLEEKIFPHWLSIQEDPHIKKGLGSKCFDLDGIRTSSKMIIENGVLKTWLLDDYFARKMNLISTANSGGVHNWIILGISDISLNKLLMTMHKGVLITELLGNGLNLSTGDYSCGAVGFWVENGIVEYPVSEITISGNLRDMFKNIVSIANDVDMRHKILSGSILLSSIRISGL
ncbi:MAG: metalloprotease PmbA [Buchnera aphidicola (Schlechtendalia peitan)]